MGAKLTIDNQTEHHANVSIHLVGKGNEVNAVTVKAGDKVETKFPEAVWYDVKFVADGLTIWRSGDYGAKSHHYTIKQGLGISVDCVVG